MKAILTDAAAVANATSRAMTFASRDPLTKVLPRPAVDHLLHALEPRVRRWRRTDAGCAHHVPLLLHRHDPDDGEPEAGPGRGLCVHRPRGKGDYLDGSKNYKVTLPPNIPAKRFWSFNVYDNQHRSFLETDQKIAGLDSTLPSVKKNADGSVTVWFGPKAPAGQEGNWVQTWPGKGFNVIFRLYGPLEGWFDKSWRPGDLEVVN